jgi:RecB family exonuclease
VVEREQRHSVRLGRLAFNIRTDRIDELADGGRVIIDYKTGRVDLKDWLETRPEEPQLPLYAVHNRERLTGLAFASLKPGEMRFAGLAGRAGIAPGVQEYAVYRQRPEGADDWGQLLNFWEQALGALASEYTQGEARVAPKSLQTCRHCHLAILCRIHELTGMAAEEVEDAD